MAAFADRVRSGGWTGHTGERIRSIVNIGISGSDLGPVMAYEALRAYSQRDLTFRFVSNVDGTDLIEAFADLTVDETQFIVCSKTFTTQETLTNARAARDWVLAALKDEAAIADRINDLKRATDLLTAELTNLDARLAEAAPVVLTDEELNAYVTGLRSVLTTRPLDEQRAFLGAWVRDITAIGKTITIQYTVPGHIGGDGSDGGGPAHPRGGRPARRADQRAAARVNQIRRVLATTRNSPPGAARTP